MGCFGHTSCAMKRSKTRSRSFCAGAMAPKNSFLVLSAVPLLPAPPIFTSRFKRGGHAWRVWPRDYNGSLLTRLRPWLALGRTAFLVLRLRKNRAQTNLINLHRQAALFRKTSNHSFPFLDWQLARPDTRQLGIENN